MFKTVQGLGTPTQVAVSVLAAVVLTALSYAVAQHWGWLGELNMAPAFAGVPGLQNINMPLWYLEVLAVLTAYSTTYLCVVQSRANYPIGFVNAILFSLLYWQYGLIGSVITNIYLPLALAYGYFRWGPDGNTRPVHNVKPLWVPVYLAVTAFTFAVVMGAIVHYGVAEFGTLPQNYVAAEGTHQFMLGGWGFYNSQVPPADIVLLALTILAQFLLDNKKLQTWIVWIVIDVIAIYVYAQQGLALVAIQYVLFLLNAFWGFYMWYRSKQETDRVTAPAVNRVNWGAAQ